MSALTRTWASWVAALGRREAGTSLACFRMGVGVAALYSLLSVGLAGLLDVVWVDCSEGGYACLPPGSGLVAWLGGPTRSVMHGLYGLALASTLAVALGLGGRVSTFVALQTYLAVAYANPHVVGGYDLLITNALWLLVLGNGNATLSLDAKLRTGRFVSAAQVAAWPRYLAVFQLVVVYTTTGLHKLSADWLPAGDFAALYHVFQDPTWRRFDMRWTASVYPLTQLGTAVTWLFEVGAPVLLLWFYARATAERGGRLRRAFAARDLRVGFTALGVCLHVGILLTLDVGPFSLVALSYYFCLWGPHELSRPPGLGVVSGTSGSGIRAPAAERG